MAESNSSNNVLKVIDLNIGYKYKSIIENINFNLKQGELTAIIGVNGIGKSTLLRTMANAQEALSGSIEIDNKSLISYSPRELSSKLSVVLTEPLASKNLSVIELVALGRQPYTNWIGTLTTIDKKKIKDALTVLDLEALQHKKCYELSDGQLQRVMIARALAQDTPMILLDEPTTHLDLFHKVQILKLLKSIAHKTKKTIVFTSHEIEMAIQICDRILLLNGEDNPFGRPQDLIERRAFERIFPDDVVTFDATTGTFRIKK
ncbi:iron complex transport system ATP-binding protein [Flavobacteriaceae bacterium MAR_2009_75]|nr:iron complex transport system ATP-binding protein [Flavobacteriaceae bacterium MAR_2009_75]